MVANNTVRLPACWVKGHSGMNRSPGDYPTNSSSPASAQPLRPCVTPSPSSSSCSPPHAATSSRSFGCISPSKTPKVCGVCGDKAKSYHFGGISCDSCKAFFRRSVQNEAHRNFHCPYEGRCEVTIGSRKCCQFCRFAKCVTIGMEKGWVMTEEERLQLLRSRMEKRQKQEPHHHPTRSKTHSRKTRRQCEPSLTDLPKFLNQSDVVAVEALVNAYEAGYRSVRLDELVAATWSERSKTDILEMFFGCIKQFAHFARRLDAFGKIPISDQEVLLRCGVLELCFVSGAHIYDEVNVRWPDTNRPLYRDSPVLASDDVRRLVSNELHNQHMNFVAAFKELDLDDPSAVLLLVIVLLSPDRPGLVDGQAVGCEQERYSVLLKNYMSWRYGVTASAILYPRVLLRLPDLRELSDAHTEFHLKLESDEAEQVLNRLSSLHLEQPRNVPSNQDRESWTLRNYLRTSLVTPGVSSPEDDCSSSDGSDKRQ